MAKYRRNDPQNKKKKNDKYRAERKGLKVDEYKREKLVTVRQVYR